MTSLYIVSVSRIHGIQCIDECKFLPVHYCNDCALYGTDHKIKTKQKNKLMVLCLSVYAYNCLQSHLSLHIQLSLLH